MTIKLFLLNFLGVKLCDKMAISAYILKIVEMDPFLMLQLRVKEDLSQFSHFFVMTNFKSDRYLNNFQEHFLRY